MLKFLNPDVKVTDISPLLDVELGVGSVPNPNVPS